MVIDEEFKNLLPPLSADEFRQLEENCLKDGIRESLIVWDHDGEWILVDGHNRYKIAQKHNLPYNHRLMEFKDRDEVKLWIYRSQIGRRNLKGLQLIEIGKQMEPLIAEEARKKIGGDKKSDVYKKSLPLNKGNDKHQNSTNAKVAKVIGMSEDTYRKGKVVLGKGTPALIEDVQNGDLTIHKAYEIVTGTVSKSPKKAMDEFVQSRREAHEEFKRQKEGAVVGLRDAAKDRRNMEVLTNDFHRKFLRISRPVFDIYFEIQNAEGIDDVLRALTPKQRNEMRQTLKHTTAQLALIERRLIESESNLSGSDRAGRTY